MFTGLVECIAEISGARRNTRGLLELSLAVPLDLADSRIGDSFCIQGACLTAVGFAAASLQVEVSQETIDRTTLNLHAQGRKVNLERALRLSDRLGGHLVTGHIDGIGHVVERKNDGSNVCFRVRATPQVARYIVEKGSICMDGVSLTVGTCEQEIFSVFLIPHTLGQTTLQYLSAGDSVNLEADIIGKYVEKLLFTKGPGTPDTKKAIDEGFLSEHGFFSKIGKFK